MLLGMDDTSKTRYSNKLELLHKAAVSLVLTRTRDPYRTIQSIMDGCIVNRSDLYVWDCLEGWAMYNLDKPLEEQKGDKKQKDMVSALAEIPALVDDKGNQSIMVFLAPEPWLNGKVPPVNQFLRKYARQFVETDTRIVFLVPDTYSVPDNMKDELAVLDFELPTQQELRESYDDIIENINNARDVAEGPDFTDDQFKRLLSAGQGIILPEFEAVVSKTIVQNRDRYPDIPFEEFMRSLMAAKTEVVKRSEILEIMTPVPISDIGGLDLLKQWALDRAKCYSQAARDFGIEAPKGCALIGPPGTGKSLTMKAIAEILGVPLIRFDVGKVFNKFVGESEGRVRSALNMLEAMSPCVAFIDEVDKAGLSSGSGGDSGVGSRILGSILTFMQESDAEIFWGFSANRVDGVPPELLRKGRLDETFSVTVPNEIERLEILKIHLKKRGHDPAKVSNLKYAVGRSENYVAAELEAAVKSALIEAFTADKPLTGELIAEQIRDMRPLSEAFREDFEAMRTWAENNAKPSSSPVVAEAPKAVVKTSRRRVSISER
jgi:SpoVK/Ycf46/Vps4 family AAA+-type ATPase